MANKELLKNQKDDFKNDCKLINLKYEYSGYTGKEKWAVVTDLAEDELIAKYPDLIRGYMPFVVLTKKQGEIIKEYQNNEARERMRALRHGHIFGIDDGEFELHHPELAVYEDVTETIVREDEIKQVLQAVDKYLTEVQKRRILKYYLGEKTYREIAAEENVSVSKIKNSVSASIKKLKNILSESNRQSTGV